MFCGCCVMYARFNCIIAHMTCAIAQLMQTHRGSDKPLRAVHCQQHVLILWPQPPAAHALSAALIHVQITPYPSLALNLPVPEVASPGLRAGDDWRGGLLRPGRPARDRQPGRQRLWLEQRNRAGELGPGCKWEHEGASVSRELPEHIRRACHAPDTHRALRIS